MAGVSISCLVIPYILAFADILFKTPLFPLLIGLWLDVWLLVGPAQVLYASTLSYPESAVTLG